MKLDFLDVLSQPMTKVGGHCGTQGTTSVHAGCGVPPVLPLSGTTRDNFSAAEANTGICPAGSPSCPAPEDASKTLHYAAVPRVPQCLPQNKTVLHVISTPVASHKETTTDPPTTCSVHPVQATTNEPPSMPTGVRLLAWEPKQPPVALSVFSVVNDTQKFIVSTLQQLDAALRGNPWAAGNWTVRDLCERLEQVGVRIEVDVACRARP